ncbi:YceI family protein, partial [Aldersonia kunmingensis]|uniref:YceI family protein n=1 Tax=Aldersonia kunmingensis TaxID=408066 RepID=UPI000A05603A
MNLRPTSRALVAGMAIVAALTMTACSSDDDNGSSTTTSKATTSASDTTAQADTPPVPSAEDLNAQLQIALDPAVPSSEKADMVQGAEADPELPNRLAEAYKQSGATIVVTSVQDLGGSLQANADFTINGQVNPVTVPFVAEDGKWKIEKTWACSALMNLQIQSPA